MIKETITYKNYNGVEVTEDFYFNLTRAEVTEMELSIDGGLAEMLERVIAAKDAPTIIKTFKEFVLKCYGEKSPDGKYFMKEDANGRPLSDKFKHTEAYSIVFMKLAFDADAAAKFINGVIPKDLVSTVPAPVAE